VQLFEGLITWTPAALGSLILAILVFVFQIKKIAKEMQEAKKLHVKHLARAAKQVDELHEWHDVRDEDGVKIWYRRRSLEEKLETLTKSIDAQTNQMSRLIDRLEHDHGK